MEELGVQVFASVWDALEASPEQAMALRLRSDLLSAVKASIDGWSMTRAGVETRLGLTPSRLDDVLHGRIDALSLDELVVIAGRAGIVIRVEPVPAAA